MNQTATDLRNALDYLREHGWHQGSLYLHGYGSPACAIGGIHATITGERYFMACERLSDTLAALGLNPDIPIWNDNPRTSFEDVELAFKHAIYDAELA